MCRLSEDEVVANEKIKAQELIQFSEKWNLTQCVEEPTCLDNIQGIPIEILISSLI